MKHNTGSQYMQAYIQQLGLGSIIFEEIHKAYIKR